MALWISERYSRRRDFARKRGRYKPRVFRCGYCTERFNDEDLAHYWYRDDINVSFCATYARNLEEAGYVFTKDDKDHRGFTDHDILTFKALVDLLARRAEYGSAVNSVVERYRRLPNSDSVAVVATTDSRTEVAMLNAKVDELVQAVSLLSSKIDEIVDERVRDRVAAAASGISDQVNQVLEEVRSDRIRSKPMRN